MTQNQRCPYPIPTIDEIIKIIEKMAWRYDKDRFISDVFECGAIAVSNRVDWNEAKKREERYEKILAAYDDDGKKAISEVFGKIFALLSSVVYEDGVFADYLGDLFMRCGAGNKYNGQFFTPYHVSQAMAKCGIAEDLILEKKRTDGILSMNDPCCGGGGLMIAGLEVLHGAGLNYARNCYIECSDIDARCVYMTYLQLALAGASAVVKHQDAISQQVWSVWRTPAYMLQYPRFHQIEEKGRRRA